MAKATNAVFISYRREASWTLVEALYQRLVAAGIDAFYDIESIRAGQFEEIILNQIRARPYFVLVLTPGTLDRCSQRGDWLRREVETAVDSGRMIVPVHTPAFDLSTVETLLPEGLGRRVASYQAVELPHRYFKFAVQQLTTEYLVPRRISIAPIRVEDRVEVERIRRAASQAPKVTPRQLSAHRYLERALGRADGDLDGKIADYTEAIRLNPRSALAFNNRGNGLWAKGDRKGALADYTEAIRVEPRYASAFNNRGNVRWATKDAKGAIADYTEAIRLDRGYALAFYNRANARQATGDVKGAIADYTEAIRLDPGYARAFNNRGSARRAQGDVKGALADFAEGRRLERDHRDPRR
jgi:tetratricopeptide (TPR) repeat protein